jgi:N-acetylglucosamine transport system permease protein
MRDRSRSIFIAICVIPGFLLTLVFMIYPVLGIFYNSFFQVTMLTETPVFIGLENFKYMLTDATFWLSLKNTCFLMLIVPVITLSLAIILAFIFTQSKSLTKRERRIFTAIFYFPNMLSMVVIGILWSFIFHPNMGILNFILEHIGLGNLTRVWLGDKTVVLYCVAATMVWQAAGYYMVMFIAGLDAIPPEIFESAMLDGANEVHKLIYITVPYLWEIIRRTLVLAIFGVLFMSFLIVQVMTNGGPGTASMVVIKYMYDQAFSMANYGYGAAIAVVAMVIAFGLAYLSNVLTKNVYTE